MPFAPRSGFYPPRINARSDIARSRGGQAVLGRQLQTATPWLTERHGYDPTSRFGLFTGLHAKPEPGNQSRLTFCRLLPVAVFIRHGSMLAATSRVSPVEADTSQRPFARLPRSSVSGRPPQGRCSRPAASVPPTNRLRTRSVACSLPPNLPVEGKIHTYNPLSAPFSRFRTVRQVCAPHWDFHPSGS